MGTEFDVDKVKFSEAFTEIIEKKTPNHIFTHVSQWINSKKKYQCTFQFSLFVRFIMKFGFTCDCFDMENELGGFSTCLFTTMDAPDAEKINAKHLNMTI